MHGFKSIPVALAAAVILPGPQTTSYRKKKKKPLSRKGSAPNGRSTRVTSKEAPQAVSKLEMKRQCELPLSLLVPRAELRINLGERAHQSRQTRRAAAFVASLLENQAIRAL